MDQIKEIERMKELKEIVELMIEAHKIEYYINYLKYNLYFNYEIEQFIFEFNEKYKLKLEVAWYFRRDIFEQRSMMNQYHQLLVLKDILMQYSFSKYLESFAIK